MSGDKKTAALNPSAPTDGGQLSHLNKNSIAENPVQDNPYMEKTDMETEEFFRQLQDPNFLQTVSMTQLFDSVYPGKPAIIEDFLHTGVYLFAGAPKVGKSFFMGQLAYHVSKGLPLDGRKVHQGAVLYLALEDTYHRLQSRLYRMFGTEVTPELHFAVCAKLLGEGLEEQVAGFLSRHENTRLVIVDTLQKIRRMERENCSYALDYAVMGRLKTLADQNKICVLVVHHTRKEESAGGQRFARISGTNGLFGAADGAFLMEKDPQQTQGATLEVTGRDQPDQRFRLKRDPQTLTWQMECEKEELWKEPPDPVLEAVAAVIHPEQPQWKGTATELVACLPLDIKPNALSMLLNVRASRLLHEYGIQYENRREHSGRYIKLTLLLPEA